MTGQAAGWRLAERPFWAAADSPRPATPYPSASGLAVVYFDGPPSSGLRRLAHAGPLMTLLAIVLISAAVLTVAYFTYGPLLSRLLQLDPKAETPAVTLRDDVDYAPIEPKFLLSQHFSAIAAAGPIVGPIVAGVAFGWLPAWLWILFGSILIGGVHDFTTLVASIRHNAPLDCRSGSRPHEHAGLFAVFGLRLVEPGLHHRGVYRHHGQRLRRLHRTGRRPNGPTITGGGVATSSLLYLVAADRDGLAAALHAAVDRLGNDDFSAAGRRGDLGRPENPVRHRADCSTWSPRRPSGCGTWPCWAIASWPRSFRCGCCCNRAAIWGAISSIWPWAAACWACCSASTPDRISRVHRLGFAARARPCSRCCS